MFRRVLIANRGEIACRIAATLREMNIAPIMVCSEADRGARHARLGAETLEIGPAEPRASYLNIDALIDAARRARADAVHPGYGFLAENAAFAEAVEAAGLTFIGPAPEQIRAMGDKRAARALAEKARVPVVPGAEGADASALAKAAARIGYPVMVKAALGGGGKGMRVVADEAALREAVESATRLAESAFGDGAVYLEKRLERARHIEVQVLGDGRGKAVHLFERECSLQRRHQKVIEECPSPAVDEALRQRLTFAAVSLAEAVRYRGAGTLEFLLAEDGAFYFLEMNTRLQVEHPVTEMVTAIDLVRWQIRIARGERLDLDPEAVLVPIGHAIECRVYAEDPDNNFLPSPGRIGHLRTPAGPGIRDESGTGAGLDVPIFYDPLISKLVAWAEDRPQTIARMRRALGEYLVTGIKTTLPFFAWLLAQPEFLESRFHTTYLDDVLKARNGRSFDAAGSEAEAIATIAAAIHASLSQGVAAGPPAATSRATERWKTQARLDGLRDGGRVMPGRG
ncbi:MAG TPA: biotin carboxylase N-terminal domain-containing protein [Candidatus Saccharimonadaceae bacterium]|nr:biotin carboxylase N-terminal domain-containing protein [Candidatus Saccharimonadaceae bacterium]